MYQLALDLVTPQLSVEKIKAFIKKNIVVCSLLAVAIEQLAVAIDQPNEHRIKYFEKRLFLCDGCI
jgi:hypothetical protein